jgi:hypothetical protein
MYVQNKMYHKIVNINNNKFNLTLTMIIFETFSHYELLTNTTCENNLSCMLSGWFFMPPGKRKPLS